jgi:hypothetical protein
MGKHPRLPKGSVSGTALRSTDDTVKVGRRGNGKRVIRSGNGNHSHSDVNGNGYEGARSISDLGSDLYVVVTSGYEKGIFIPGGRYEPGQFPILKRLMAESRGKTE